LNATLDLRFAHHCSRTKPNWPDVLPDANRDSYHIPACGFAVMLMFTYGTVFYQFHTNTTIKQILAVKHKYAVNT